ncbi:hypothetical protein [Anabaena azotica]|uniref:Uncharacterized protein n=1 Tax=Anabaena azotica FACHB-119 TaxID=947527 RepID=A0ABR8DB38_9NOST|nr:hypothetical protein [Anabaena azotica]MBD2503422.1 hypothetical protein [Anabaena azotica FACHB-119]
MSINQFRRVTKARAKDLLYIIDTSGNRPLTKLIESSDLIGTAVNGKSAYEIALNNGFEGTEQEWLSSLKGKNTLAAKSISLNTDVNGDFQGNLTLTNGFALTKVEADNPIRVRLYLNQTFGNSDISRGIGTSLPVSHGLIYESVFAGNTKALDVLPSAIAFPFGDCFLVVNNPSGSQNITMTFNYIQLI